MGTSEVQHILVVEDEDAIRDLLQLHLKREGLLVDAVASAEEASRFLKNKQYSLIALDWMLPGASGIEFARAVRKDPSWANMAILMITARTQDRDIVEGLEAGADDYVTKPFDPAVLMARVRALLRRQERLTVRKADSVGTEGLQVVRIGGLSLFPETHECTCNGEAIQLTVSEFKLLMALAESGGRVLTRDRLIDQIQGEGVSVVGRTIDTHVFGLRKKLGECADVVETVRGVGYRVKPPSETQ